MNEDVLKSMSPCILLNKIINFDKNETESKMENSTHSFREKNLVLQLMQGSQIKGKKNCDELELVKEKIGHFLYRLFCPKGIFLRFVFYSNVLYIVNTISEYTYFYISKNITSYTFVACV